MSRPRLAALLVLVVLGSAAGVAGALGAFGGEEGSDDEVATGSGAAKHPAMSAWRTEVRPQGCGSLRLSPSARVELERVLGKPTVMGSVYYGSCNGRYWATARFRAGGDGVFRDVRSGRVVALGSIAQARCKIPYGLLKLWSQADHCVAASSDPSAGRDDPQSTVKVPDPQGPDPQAPDPQTRAERCRVPEVKVPNYDPTDDIPDQRLPRPEELLPPRDKCPEAYEGIRDDNPQPDGQRRYPNGRTYIEQINFCSLMRSQGVPCTVPPPP